MPVVPRIAAVAGIAGVLTVAAWLRFDHLEAYPMHADEAATGAQTLAYRLESSAYVFDPAHGHGPLLTAMAAPWCRLQGENDWESLRAVTLRRLVAACGLGAVIGIFGLGMGWLRAGVAALLAATSPLLVYYSRIFIHEPVFVLFAIPALIGLLGLLKNNRPWLSACALGLGVGGMAATRETVVISLAAWSVAGFFFAWRREASRGVPRVVAGLGARLWKPLLLAAGIALAIIFWFYSGGGRRPAGFVDFFATYFQYKTGEGFDRPFGWFFALLVWPKHALGCWWTEAGILMLALCVYLDRRWGSLPAAAGRFFLEAGLLHLLALSLIAYKTPWLASLGWFHCCLAGGYGAVALARRFPVRWRILPVAGIALIAGWQGAQAQRAVSARFSSDARNPYACVPTSKDAARIAGFLENLRAADPETREPPLAVIGDHYWPLPWYLRGAGKIGYWSRLPKGAEALPVLLLLPSALDEARPALQETHTFLPRGLRDEFPVVIAVRNDLWEAYRKQ